MQELQLTYAKAVNHALKRALEEFPESLFFGEDVGKPGGVFGVTKGLWEQFGSRVIDTPISETAMLGTAVGAAIAGLRPIVEIMWIDFTLVAADQIINQAANVRYVSAGRLSAPLTIRTQQGAMPGSCAQHSQNLEALYAHIPGIRVTVVGTAQDAYSVLLSAIAANDPVLVIESRTLYHGEPQSVIVDGPIEPIGRARIARSGDTVTILTWGPMLSQALASAEELAAQGIEAEVIDARWISPFDWDVLFASLEKTQRLVIVHEANLTGGFGAEVAARANERMFDKLKAPVVRLGAPDIRMPAAPHLQAALIPDAADITRAVSNMVATPAYAQV